MKGIFNYFTGFLFTVFFISTVVLAQNPTTTAKTGSKPKTKTKKKSRQKEEKPKPKTKSVAFGGQFLGNMSVYVAAADMIKFNIRYYSRAVYTYAYFVSRPHKLKMVFKDYKGNYIIVHLNNTSLFNIPNLYSDKMYEIRARVGREKNGKLHMKFISMKPMFLEKKFLDR